MPGFRQAPGGNPCIETVLVDSTTGAQVLSSAPGTDTGQRALAVRVVSQLGAGTGGGSSGGLTDTQLRATPVPVSGTFWPGTQPVSIAAAVPVTDNAGSLTVDSTQLPSALAGGGGLKVEGVVGGVAQPVTGPLTDNQLRAAAVPVSGPLTDVQLRASTVPVSVSGVALDATLTGGTQRGKITDGTNNAAVKAASTAAVVADPALVVAISPNNSVAVTGPLTDTQLRASAVPVSGPLTDTQLRATAVPVKQPKDTARAQVCLAWEEMAGTAAVESTLTNFTAGSRAGVALTAATNLTVTAGKTLRIQAVNIYVKATSTVNNLARFRIRQAASSIANTSPIIFDHVLALEVTGTIAANAFHEVSVPIPDGIEVAAGQQITFTWFTAANTCTVGMTVIGYEY